jgi:6-phosphogluconolactonase
MHRAALGLAVAAMAAAATGPGTGTRTRTGTEKAMIYVGTYTNTGSKGIYRVALDLATGALAAVGQPAIADNPSWLVLHPSGRFLYAVNETGDAPGDPSGGVSAFAIGKDGALTFLNRQPSEGAAPCHLAVDKAGRHLLVANYWGGTVAVLPIAGNGTLGAATTVIRHAGKSVHPQQEDPHPHSVDFDPAGRVVFVSDLGLDEVVSYRYAADRGELTRASAARQKPGAGPRHLALHPDGHRAFVINEIDNTLTRMAVEPDAGALQPLESVSTLPAGFAGKSATAEVAVHRDGRLVFASNRGHDSIAIFAIDPATGALSAVGHEPTRGRNPRHFAIDPTGSWLVVANQDPGSLAVFRIDRASGRLQAVGEPMPVPRAVCVRFAR